MTASNPLTVLQAAKRAALEQKARVLRATCVQMAHDGREGHLSGELSCIEILVALFNRWLRLPEDAKCDPSRDRFICSKGHAAAAVYAAMADRGLIAPDLLSCYAQDDSPLPSHLCRHALPSLDCPAGSLGHGLGVATGMCKGLLMDRLPSRVAVLLSDGECNEGSVWEASMFAAAHRLENLVAVVDYNGVQAVGRTDEITGGTSFAEKFRAFGWGAKTVDGHSVDALCAALDETPFEKGKPSAIVAKTVAGKGVSFMEDRVLWHYRVPSDDDLRKALAELGVCPLHVKKGGAQ